VAEIVLMKTAGGVLAPVDQAGIDYLQKLKVGAGVSVTIKRHNNVKYHRKLFALANYAFDCWEPQAIEHRGQVVEKQFDQFRDDITILAGFYSTRVRLDGTVRLIADSWSFAKMDDDKKEALFNGIINAVLKHILTKSTREDIDNIIENLLRYD